MSIENLVKARAAVTKVKERLGSLTATITRDYSNEEMVGLELNISRERIRLQRLEQAYFDLLQQAALAELDGEPEASALTSVYIYAGQWGNHEVPKRFIDFDGKVREDDKHFLEWLERAELKARQLHEQTNDRLDDGRN